MWFTTTHKLLLDCWILLHNGPFSFVCWLFLSQRADLFPSRRPLPHSTRTSFLRTRTIFIHQWTFPFWLLWLRVRTFLYFASGPFSITKWRLPITWWPFCSSGPFIHNMSSSFPHTRTDRIHSPGPSELFHATSFSRADLPHPSLPPLLCADDCFLLHADLCQLTFFFRGDHFARRVWISSSRTLTVFILEDPGTTMIFEQHVRTFLPKKRHRWTFSQRSQIVLV